MNYITAIYGVALVFGTVDWLFRARFEFAFDSGGVDHTQWKDVGSPHWLWYNPAQMSSVLCFLANKRGGFKN